MKSGTLVVRSMMQGEGFAFSGRYDIRIKKLEQ